MNAIEAAFRDATKVYPWIAVDEDGGVEADMAETTPAEMDRRLIIVQEIGAGRLRPVTS